MTRNILITLGLFWLSFSAVAASFDCNKAQGQIERMICADQWLSELDEHLSENYNEMRKGLSPNKDRQLVSAQRKWIKNIRNECYDTHCLSKAYLARAKELSPFSDDKVTCDEMRKRPRQIFGGSIELDLGSGHTAKTDVDYQCPESLASQPFLQRLMFLAEEIRAEDAPQPCSGSIIYAWWRGYQFTLTEAGIAPMMFQKQWDNEPFDLRTGIYFQQWAEQSPYNYELYREFTKEYDQGVHKLAQHYQQANKWSLSQSRIIADHAMQIIRNRAAGSFPQDAVRGASEIVELARDKRSTNADLRKALANTEVPVLKGDIYGALKAALLQNREPQFIQLMIEKLSKEDFQSLGKKEEPLLAFALSNQKLMSMLLAAGSPVDAQNEFGKTALFYAVGLNAHESVELLLDNQADVNHTYKSAEELRPETNGYVDECNYPNLRHTSRTPIMHAAQSADVEMLKLLISRGAKMNATDDLGFNALDYAVMGSRKDNEDFLASQGMKPSPSKIME